MGPVKTLITYFMPIPDITRVVNFSDGRKEAVNPGNRRLCFNFRYKMNPGRGKATLSVRPCNFHIARSRRRS